MPEPVIQFQNIYKKFARGEAHGTLRDLVAATVGKLFGKKKDESAQLKGQEFWAVKDLSFSLQKGESMGIIGPNGSGKSTTLKLLSGILRADRGTYDVKGRLSALIEVGAGFHPDLTGRENVYLNGSILGMTRKEVKAKFADIVEFSGVSEFIDTPVKRYSSGMAVRLGFAVAAFVEPDVLLVDEVLAVGDTEFRNRCHNRMMRMLNNGVTMILVSHDLTEVRNLCQNTVMLWKGVKVLEGPTPKVVEEYHSRVVEMVKAEQDKQMAKDSAARPHLGVEITKLTFIDKNGIPAENFSTGDPMTVRIHYNAHKRIARPAADLSLDWAAEDIIATTCDTRRDGVELAPIEIGPGHIDCKFGPLLMEPNVYSVNARLTDADNELVLDTMQRQRFILNEGVTIYGLFGIPHDWVQSKSAEKVAEAAA